MPPNPPSAAEDLLVADRIRAVGAGLGSALRAVLEALPDRPGRPSELAQALTLNRDISGRVLSAAARRDPIEVVSVVPGPEPLRTFLKSAAEHEVPVPLIETARDAVRRFELLIRDEAGTRSNLDAIISVCHPPTRERFELASRQSVHKGMSQLKGATADAWVSVAIIHPTAGDEAHHDVAHVHGAIGMRRLRPGVRVKFNYRKLAASDETVETPPHAAIDLAPLCPNPPARLEAERFGDAVCYTLAETALGPGAVTDAIVVDHNRGVLNRAAAGRTRSKKGAFVAPQLPVQTLLFDVMLHEDAYPGAEPELTVFEMGTGGTAWVNDASRDMDRIDVPESIEVLGRDLRSMHAEEIPRYGAMLESVCTSCGWDPAAFRGFRCRARYPVPGWQYCMSFQPPEA